jgi:hypothetical protein
MMRIEPRGMKGILRCRGAMAEQVPHALNFGSGLALPVWYDSRLVV